MADTTEGVRGAVIAPVLGEDERGELERLRQEVAALRVSAVPRPRRRIRWASVAAAVLLVLGCVGVPVSVVAVWTHNQVADTDRFVATMSPVILSPAVQSALTDRISSEVLAYIDDRPSGVEVLFVPLGLVLALGVIEFVGQEPEPPTHGVATAVSAPG
jgi:hypothetical protein